MSVTSEAPAISLNDIRNFFGMGTAEFSREWRALSGEDKTHIRVGLTNGSKTY